MDAKHQHRQERGDQQGAAGIALGRIGSRAPSGVEDRHDPPQAEDPDEGRGRQRHRWVEHAQRQPLQAARCGDGQAEQDERHREGVGQRAPATAAVQLAKAGKHEGKDRRPAGRTSHSGLGQRLRRTRIGLHGR